MKLLAKTAEERYQTAVGVQSDLRRCLAEWETRCRIDEFLLGEHDIPDRLLIPEKLYGRAREIDTLLASFDRVVASSTPSNRAALVGASDLQNRFFGNGQCAVKVWNVVARLWSIWRRLGSLFSGPGYPGAL